MAEYIERETAIDVIMSEPTDAHYPSWYADKIESISVADVVPVRHGRWIGAPLWGNDNCRCSECGSWCNIHVNLRGKVIQKYCPYCGAKMTMEEEDG